MMDDLNNLNNLNNTFISKAKALEIMRKQHVIDLSMLVDTRQLVLDDENHELPRLDILDHLIEAKKNVIANLEEYLT